MLVSGAYTYWQPTARLCVKSNKESSPNSKAQDDLSDRVVIRRASVRGDRGFPNCAVEEQGHRVPTRPGFESNGVERRGSQFRTMTSSPSLGHAPGAASTFPFTVDSFSAQPSLLPHSQPTSTHQGRTDSAGTRTPGGGKKNHSSNSTVITTSNFNTNQLPGPGSNLDTFNTTTAAVVAAPPVPRNNTTTSSSTGHPATDGNGSDKLIFGGDQSNVHHTHRQHHNSSKLPAFRFADLKKKDASLFPPSLPLLQPTNIHIPPSPNKTSTAGDLKDPANPPQFNQQQQPEQQQLQPTSPFNHNLVNRPQLLSAEERSTSTTTTTATAAATPPRQAHKRLQDHPAIRASTFQPFSPTAPVSSIGSKRPASSVCDSQSTARGPYVSRYRSASIVTPLRKRRQTTSTGLLPSTDSPAQGRPREPVPSATTKSKKINEKRRSRPSTSPTKTAIVLSASGRGSGGQAANTSPTKTLRSSTSRDNDLPFDYDDYNSGRTVGDTNDEGDMSNSTQRDRALRALEGRRDDDMSRMTPPDSATEATDNENTAEIFMNIAREDPAPRPAQTRTEDQSAIVSRF